jgi:hypothetical protein
VHSEIYEAYEYKTVGIIQKILELSGAKNPKVELSASMPKGDQYTEFTCTWE